MRNNKNNNFTYIENYDEIKPFLDYMESLYNSAKNECRLESNYDRSKRSIKTNR